MFNFQDLPDELILEILSYTEIKALISCGQVAKSIRRVSHDTSLWMTVNLEKKTVKTELLEMILGKGCKILNITDTNIIGSLSMNIKSQLRVVNLTNSSTRWYPEYIGVLEELLFSSCCLQYLAMDGLGLTPKMADSICKNGKTLLALNLDKCNIITLSMKNRSRRRMQEIFECCQELKDINFNGVKGLDHDDLKYLAEIIPPNVEELNLGCLSFMDYHVKVLLSRCKKVKKLSIQSMWIPITDESLTNISHYLNLTLEELSFVASQYTTVTGLSALKNMPKLKRLNLYNSIESDCEEIQKLRQYLPHLMIRTSYPRESLKKKYSLTK